MEEQIIERKNLIFSVAKIFVFNDKEEILVLKRSEWKKIPGEDYRPDLSHAVDLPGGIIGDGNAAEDALSGVIRELEEETGIRADASMVRLVYAETNYKESSNRSQNRFLYMLRLENTPEVNLSWEHESFEWVNFDEIALSEYFISAINNNAMKYLHEHRDIFGLQ